MLTKTSLEKKIKELESKINKIGYEIKSDFILRYKLYKDEKNYEEKKENLIKRGYEYKSTNKTEYIWYPRYEFEIWEKNMGTITQ